MLPLQAFIVLLQQMQHHTTSEAYNHVSRPWRGSDHSSRTGHAQSYKFEWQRVQGRHTEHMHVQMHTHMCAHMTSSPPPPPNIRTHVHRASVWMLRILVDTPSSVFPDTHHNTSSWYESSMHFSKHFLHFIDRSIVMLSCSFSIVGFTRM